MKLTSAIVLLFVSLACLQARADEPVMFGFQGRVKVSGQAFTGTGNFKYAIVNASGSATLWSNDNTSVNGSEPSSSIPAQVTDGVFSVMIGDPSIGMQTINSAIFYSEQTLKLRTWFSDGIAGFEQLHPDHNLANVSLVSLRTPETDFTLYVNGSTGNDAQNGLTTNTAKRTIQAAVDTLPGRLQCNVTISIASGIYREEVLIAGIDIRPRKKLLLIGDSTWTPASPSEPSVRITGVDVDGPSGVRVRESAIRGIACSGVELHGLLCDETTSGIYLRGGIFKIADCKLTRNYCGLVGERTDVETYDVVSNGNSRAGYMLGMQSFITLTDCTGNNNGENGIDLNGYSIGRLLGTGQYNSNAFAGIHLNQLSQVLFGPIAPYYTGQLLNNGQYSLSIVSDSIAFYTFNNSSNKPNRLTWGGKIYD